MIWLAEHQPMAVKNALDQIEDAHYFSQRDMLNHMTQDYTNRAKTLLSIGLGLIVVLLIGRYRSLIKAVQTLLPAVLAAFLILAAWSFTGEAVSFLHLVGFLLVVAICVDYGIFYQENRGGDLGLTYQAMAASMLTSALAFGCLVMAESTSLRILASVVAFGVVLGFIFCPLLIKSERSES
jgi:predicted exporter